MELNVAKCHQKKKKFEPNETWDLKKNFIKLTS